MKTTSDIIMNSSKHLISAILVSGLLCLGLQAAAPAGKEAPAKGGKDAAATAPSKQKSFDTPEQAAASLIEAAAAFEVAALKEILGPDSDDIIASDDPVMDKQRALAFAAKAKEKQAIAIDPKNPDLAILSVGEDAFPLPIPIVRNKEQWSFDTKAGVREILLRRIGANELDAIAICRGFCEAQHEYARQKHDGAVVNQYAQRIISTPGKQDGLAWQNAEGAWEGPVGEGIAKALEQGYTKKDQPQPYHGYFFKVLKGQGPAAPLGQMDFVVGGTMVEGALVGGAMIGGFALAVAPAEYQVTGVKTFIVSHTGIVYEKDLGPNTLAQFQKLDRFNPDKSWLPTEDQWEEEGK
ncbi:MAG: DUF2950 domain-containing protein [Verrucomicrobia bacterium]|nr:DUF2950 domain-containing protein [Verrucomicrobiota bacterium]